MIPITELDALDRGTLAALWSETFGEDPPKGISQGLMRRFLADEIQARQRGGVSTVVAKAYGRIASGTDIRAQRPLSPGGRYIREWNGTTHVVEATKDGYLWKGQAWRSLSAIAREITGAHWSGPRFFGLTRAAGGDGKRATRSPDARAPR